MNIVQHPFQHCSSSRLTHVPCGVNRRWRVYTCRKSFCCLYDLYSKCSCMTIVLPLHCTTTLAIDRPRVCQCVLAVCASVCVRLCELFVSVVCVSICSRRVDVCVRASMCSMCERCMRACIYTLCVCREANGYCCPPQASRALGRTHLAGQKATCCSSTTWLSTPRLAAVSHCSSATSGYLVDVVSGTL